MIGYWLQPWWIYSLSFFVEVLSISRRLPIHALWSVWSWFLTPIDIFLLYLLTAVRLWQRNCSLWRLFSMSATLVLHYAIMRWKEWWSKLWFSFFLFFAFPIREVQQIQLVTIIVLEALLTLFGDIGLVCLLTFLFFYIKRILSPSDILHGLTPPHVQHLIWGFWFFILFLYGLLSFRPRLLVNCEMFFNVGTHFEHACWRHQSLIWRFIRIHSLFNRRQRSIIWEAELDFLCLAIFSSFIGWSRLRCCPCRFVIELFKEVGTIFYAPLHGFLKQ